jgi:hypothetical protein
MRDVAFEPLPDDPAALPSPYVGDDAFARLPPAGVNAATGLVDKAFNVADKAHTMPATGGEFAPGRSVLVSGPTDGGLAKMEAGATVTAPAAPVAKPAYAMTGRSINPATKKRLFPWLNTPKKGLNTSYESNVANPGLLEAPAHAVAMGAVGMETPRDDEDGGEEEDEGVEQHDEKAPAKRARPAKKAK